MRMAATCAIAVLCLVASGPARAFTFFLYNGSMCQGTNDSDRSKLIYNTYGVNDVGTTAVTLVCPASTFNVSALRFHDAVVRVYDRNCSLDTTVTLRLVNEDNTLQYFTQSVTTSGCPIASQEKTFAVPGVLAVQANFTTTTLRENAGNGFSAIASYGISTDG